MVPPTRPNVTRLADDRVMVRWSVPSNDEGLPIMFFKVQYRFLGNNAKLQKRSQWMTSDVDIAPNTFMYEVEGLKPGNFYRFRIAAVYSNNDNQLSNASRNFYLKSIKEIDPKILNLPSPNLTRVEPISDTSVLLHWTLPENNRIDVDGFYAYFRPASTAGEYSKATIDGMEKRSFQIDDLEPGTAYEFKLQSFTASAASDFLAIITGKTLSELSFFLPLFSHVNYDSNVIYINFFTRRTIDSIANRSECHNNKQKRSKVTESIPTCCWFNCSRLYFATHNRFSVFLYETTKEIWFTRFVFNSAS